jgi:opacity protein-like surface antigen
MPRPLAAALLALLAAAPARAADADPDKLLPPTTQLYVRWDGVTAHNDAYKKSVWGPVMAGPTGDSVRAMLAKGPSCSARR